LQRRVPLESDFQRHCYCIKDQQLILIELKIFDNSPPKNGGRVANLSQIFGKSWWTDRQPVTNSRHLYQSKIASELLQKRCQLKRSKLLSGSAYENS
jgi:hypothetical protein